MKTVLSLFPLLRRFNEAGNERVPVELIRSLAMTYQPSLLNQIQFQYKIWTFIAALIDCCESCGDHLPIGSRSTTSTCSNRCHKLVVRAREKGEPAPMEIIRTEAKARLDSIHNLSQRPAIANGADLLSNYPWHRVTDGWKAQVQ